VVAVVEVEQTFYLAVVEQVVLVVVALEDRRPLEQVEP
jgi:hypothetical protein